MEDSAIIDLYLARDESAISETSNKYGARLRQIANRILQDPPSAEACENETYFHAWNSIPPAEPRTYLYAYLGQITRHLAIDEYRKSGAAKRSALLLELTQEMEECLPSGSGVEEETEAEALTNAINAYLARCPAEKRGMFMRRYWHFDTVPEISKVYGCTRSKVKTTLFRMRRELKEYLEKEGFLI